MDREPLRSVPPSTIVLRGREGRRPHPAPGSERRLLSVRPKLLPALPAGGAAGGGGRPPHLSQRLSLCHPSSVRQMTTVRQPAYSIRVPLVGASPRWRGLGAALGPGLVV